MRDQAVKGVSGCFFSPFLFTFGFMDGEAPPRRLLDGDPSGRRRPTHLDGIEQLRADSCYPFEELSCDCQRGVTGQTRNQDKEEDECWVKVG